MAIRITIILYSFMMSASNSANTQNYTDKLVAAALDRTKEIIIYNGRYERIDYPMGDVSPHFGVCTDVVIRTLRKVGIDLQQLIHEDMIRNFDKYPQLWGLKKPDSNIDHRRVPNIQAYLERHQQSLEVSSDADDYQPGDVVTWMLPGHKSHIGIVIKEKTSKGIPLIVHNVGLGPKKEDFLFSYPVTGHYRFGLP